MHGIVLIHQLKKVICQTYTVTVLKMKWLLEITGAFLTDQMIPFAIRTGNQLVSTLQKLKVWLVPYLIIVALSIKAGLIRVLQILGVLGTKLLTTVRKTLQRVKPAQKQDN